MIQFTEKCPFLFYKKLYSVFEFDDIIASDVIIHRTELTLLFLEESMKELETQFAKVVTNYIKCDDSYE